MNARSPREKMAERRDTSDPQWERALWCPNCSARLDERGCKRVCPRCGYMTDCSDVTG